MPTERGHGDNRAALPAGRWWRSTLADRGCQAVSTRARRRSALPPPEGSGDCRIEPRRLLGTRRDALIGGDEHRRSDRASRVADGSGHVCLPRWEPRLVQHFAVGQSAGRLHRRPARRQFVDLALQAQQPASRQHEHGGHRRGHRPSPICATRARPKVAPVAPLPALVHVGAVRILDAAVVPDLRLRRSEEPRDRSPTIRTPSPDDATSA